MIALVGCASLKLTRPAPARELYVSTLFRLAMAYAERKADHVYVISAKHGIVELDHVIAPYDVMIRDLDNDARSAWAHDVVSALTSRHPPGELTLLAGKRYGELLRWPACWTVIEPMRGMMIGQRLRWLSREVTHAVP